jgi:nicotinate-nucleotide adenylyltransferase
MEPVGILGGTFDPPHLGHLALALAAEEKLGLHDLRIIPAGHPPHRGTPQEPPETRLLLVRKMCQGHPGWRADASEASCGAPSYTATTLERLRREEGPARPLVLLMGADAYAGLPGWHRASELPKLAHIAVFARKGFALPDPGLLPCPPDEAQKLLQGAPCGRTLWIEADIPQVSATQIRALLARGGDAAGLLSPAVLATIQARRLYGHGQ